MDFVEGFCLASPLAFFLDLEMAVHRDEEALGALLVRVLSSWGRREILQPFHSSIRLGLTPFLR